MLPSVSSIETRLDAGNVRGDASMTAGAVDQQLRETERALERLKRDLAAAEARAQQQEQKLAEARRRMEQWRWANAINEGDPETSRIAAASLTAQTHVVEAAVKSNADVAAHVERLQGILERQTARFFDLQSRRHATEVDERRRSATAMRESRSHDQQDYFAADADGATDETRSHLSRPARRYLTA